MTFSAKFLTHNVVVYFDWYGSILFDNDDDDDNVVDVDNSKSPLDF